MDKEKMEFRDIGQEKRTTSCTFRLRADEIQFLKSLSNQGITDGLRKLIIFGRGAGNFDISSGITGLTYALIARIERLEKKLTD